MAAAARVDRVALGYGNCFLDLGNAKAGYRSLVVAVVERPARGWVAGCNTAQGAMHRFVCPSSPCFLVGTGRTDRRSDKNT